MPMCFNWSIDWTPPSVRGSYQPLPVDCWQRVNRSVASADQEAMLLRIENDDVSWQCSVVEKVAGAQHDIITFDFAA